MFKALYLTQQYSKTLATPKPLQDCELPAGDVVVRVEYASLNYKDALAATGHGPAVWCSSRVHRAGSALSPLLCL